MWQAHSTVLLPLLAHKHYCYVFEDTALLDA